MPRSRRFSNGIPPADPLPIPSLSQLSARLLSSPGAQVRVIIELPLDDLLEAMKDAPSSALESDRRSSRESGATPKDPKVLYTTEQLAERWGMDTGTLVNWRYKGDGPRYLRLNGRRGSVRYRLADILKYEEERIKRPSRGDE